MKQRTEYQLLESIDQKLGALLTITLDGYVRSHGIKGARPKPIDVMLHDAGLSTAEIATFLGKTQRAVQVATANKTAAKRSVAKKAARRR